MSKMTLVVLVAGGVVLGGVGICQIAGTTTLLLIGAARAAYEVAEVLALAEAEERARDASAIVVDGEPV